MEEARVPTAKEWGLFAISLLVAFLVAEMACRFVLPRPGFVARHASWLPGAVRPHPTRQYALVPGFSAQVTARETFGTMHIDINADGLRERPLERLRAADVRVLAVGDSYTFGYGLPVTEAWPARLEADLQQLLPGRSVVVINAGVPGYNLAQMDDMARELLPRMTPQLLIAAVYAGGFDRMLNPMTSLGDLVMRSSDVRVTRLVDGGIVRSSMYDPTVVAMDLWLKTHWYFGAWLFEGAFLVFDHVRSHLRSPPQGAEQRDGSVERAAGIAKGLDALARLQRRTFEAGVPFAVLVVAGFGRDHHVLAAEELARREIVRYCKAAGIPVLDPTNELESADIPVRVRPTDYHWSAAANALAARKLAGFVDARGLLRPSPDRPGDAVEAPRSALLR